MSNPLHEAALALVAQGVPVFPCLPGSKVPATAHGFHDATTDPAVIDKWFADEPRLNIAYCPHLRGECVIDLDGGQDGENEWLELQLEHGFAPDTKIIRTPRGGRHIYFAGELPPTQHKLGAHIDTRGVGSYVLVPPSVVNGKPYEFENDFTDDYALAPVPEWIGERLAQFSKDAMKASVTDLDMPQNVERARSLLNSYIEAGHVAVTGEGGDARTYATACEVLNLGVSPETALELMEEWNAHCVPPWEHDELITKITNAAEYAQNEPGAWATETTEAVFGSTLDKLGLTGASSQSIQFKGYSLAEMQARPVPPWLIKEVISDHGVGMLFAPPGAGKTWLAVTLAAGAAKAGKSVAWVAGEGASDVGPRFKAWQTVHAADALPVTVFDAMPWASDGQMMQRFVDDVKAQCLNFDLIIIDTAITMMVGLNENDAKDAGQFINACKFLRDQLGCAVLFLHHSGKDTARGARGSGALSAGVDSALEVELHEPTMTFALHVRRQRSAPKRKEPWYYESKPIAGSLVLQEIDAQAYRQLTAPKTGIAVGVVHKCLLTLGAVSEESAVPTRVLASSILPMQEDETPEEREAAVTRSERSLTAAAKRELSAYALGTGRATTWRVPPLEE